MKSRRIIGFVLVCIIILCWFYRAPSPKQGAGISHEENLAETNNIAKAVLPQNTGSTASAGPPQGSTPAYTATATNGILGVWNPNTPISFYGKVVDENSTPVPDVNVFFGWNDASPSHYTRSNTTSDAQGLFSLTGVNGTALDVSLDKEGYYFSRKQNQVNFVFSNPYASRFYRPDSSNPVLFYLHKKGRGEPLVTGDKLFGFKPDGTRYYIDLLAGKKYTEPPETWDVSVSITRSPARPDRRFDWSVTFDASGGGLIETNEAFMFLAPESGYQSVEVKADADAPKWWAGENCTFYFKSRDGEFFGRIEADIMAQYRQDAAIDMKYFVNTNGSRNLEPSD